MGKAIERNHRNDPKARSRRIIAIVRKMPKMQADRRKRLTALMEKTKGQGLTRKEDREMRELLDQVDRQNYWNLAQAIETEERNAAARGARKTG